jgi:SAM-dependent methyltransferase
LNSEIYYKGSYWNDIPEVLEYICENFTGDKKKWWVEDFKNRYAKKQFGRALFLNCGNGWLEREFIDQKIVERAVAFDVSPKLVSEAKKERGERKIEYFVADANKIELEKESFDLVVNNAALHHVQLINRICYILADSLKENGYLVNFDYIGPHRNQYPLKQWELANNVNNELPEDIRQDMCYPHLPTMLATDPTEAIHSELIIESIDRYFDITERHDTGGGIAYLIFTHNKKLNKIPAEKLGEYIDIVLKYDQEYSEKGLIPPLFSYFIAKPDKDSLKKRERNNIFQDDENKREKIAEDSGGIYAFSRDYP